MIIVSFRRYRRLIHQQEISMPSVPPYAENLPRRKARSKSYSEILFRHQKHQLCKEAHPFSREDQATSIENKQFGELPPKKKRSKSHSEISVPRSFNEIIFVDALRDSCSSKREDTSDQKSEEACSKDKGREENKDNFFEVSTIE